MRSTFDPRFVLQRVGQAVIVLVAAFTVTFVLLQALPGDAIMIKFENPELGLSPQQIADIRVAYGADVPVPIQFWHTLIGFVQGDFGYSIQSGTPVLKLLAEVLPETLKLASIGFLLAVVIAVGVAFLSALTPFAWLANLLRSLPGLLVSVPVFWLGIVLIQVFSFQLKLVPVIGADPFQALILPVVTLAVPISAPLAQILVRSIDEVRLQPFVTVVRAKGASPSWVLWRNVAKNAVLPVITIAGVLFGELIAGAVVTETVFGRAGIGRLTEQAVSQQDTPVLQAIVVLAALVFVVVNLAVDLLYPVLDPRLSKRVGASV
ncbi:MULTISPECIES: ABC transporter permease [unclassified Plantibacter]|jgi:peptide/nickel transport system permease protein|uniref:ABC transporter permease n=1 Tax=unclassified Plantibacter TaxID=2624265 RepID=UPI003D34EDFC